MPQKTNQCSSIYVRLFNLLFGVFVALLIIGSTALADASSVSPLIYEPTEAFLRQDVITTTGTITTEIKTSLTTYAFSMADLDYGERVLVSPYGATEYVFRLPENWEIQDDVTLTALLTYTYDQFDKTQSNPPLMGNLTVIFDGRTIKTLAINTEFSNGQFEFVLPQDLLNKNTRHSIAFNLEADFLCDVNHNAKLIISPDTSLTLNYDLIPLNIDLARYPQPFFQRSFEPDSVYFVLPDQFTANDLTNAAGIAAKLGDLTSNNMIISATTDLAENNTTLPSVEAIQNQNMVVIGTPQDNEFVSQLNQLGDLPVSLHQRQLQLDIQGPKFIEPDEEFTYLYTVTNTLGQSTTLSVINSPSVYANLVNCSSDCVRKDDNTIVWANKLLAKGATTQFEITLKSSSYLTGTVFENVVTLFDTQLEPINTNTFTSEVVSQTSSAEVKVKPSQDGYFFVYNGLAVSEDDGIVQEFISPWNSDRAIIMVTGLNDEAVQKASRAMSTEAIDPGMIGSVALVQSIVSPMQTEDNSEPVEFTLADLDYEDKSLQGLSDLQADYYFEVPYGWQLTDQATIELYYSHSKQIDYQNSGFTLSVNKQPVASTSLSDETSTHGVERINLIDANILTGRANRLTVNVSMDVMGGICAKSDTDKAWFLIQDTSKIALVHEEVKDVELNLTRFPLPFHLDSTLADLLFVLPDAPKIADLNTFLQMAATLGDSASAKTLLPQVILAEDLPTKDLLADYHIIAIGRPSQNTFIQKINDSLIQPFMPGTDIPVQRFDDVTLRLPSDFSVAYLQLLPSIWNEEKALLVLTATTDEAINWTGDLLTNHPWDIDDGDFVLIKDSLVVSLDSRRLTKKGAAALIAQSVSDAEATPVAEATAIPAQLPTKAVATQTLQSVAPPRTGTSSFRPVWITPLVVLTGVMVIAILIIAFWRERQKNKGA